jgi:hypothetical protein
MYETIITPKAQRDITGRESRRMAFSARRVTIVPVIFIPRNSGDFLQFPGIIVPRFVLTSQALI